MSSKRDELRPEYPGTLIKSGVRGRYAKRAGKGGNTVVIDPDLRELFPDSASVNRALRDYVEQRKQKR
jgi:hypothetical protein